MKLATALAVALLGTVLAPQAWACSPPPEYTHVSQLIQDGMAVTVATDSDVYQPGQPVEFFLSIHNQTPDQFSFCSSVSPYHFFTVFPDSCSGPWDETCTEERPFFWPSLVYFFGGCVEIAAGECESWQETWDGLVIEWGEGYDFEYVPANPGLYRVKGGLWQGLWPDLPFPEVDYLLEIRISESSGVGVESQTWGGVKTALGVTHR